MAKMKLAQGTYQKICTIVAGLTLLSLSIFPGNPAAASPDDVKWSRVNIPTEGRAGNWVLADGSDIQHPTMAIDGTIYAYGAGLSYTLYKSTDGGYSWSYSGNVQDTIVDIATAPAEGYSIYYATSSNVYRSTDGGKTFKQLPSNPGGAGSNNVEITSIDVARLNSNIIVVGTRDTDSSQFGGVYTLDEKDIIPVWRDTHVGSYDVYAVAPSPNFPADRQLVAVVTDETDTFVTSKSGNAGWGTTTGNATLNKDNSGTHTSVAVAASAAIAFPGDYDADGASESCVQFVAIDTGSDSGDVYKVKGAEAPNNSVATDLNIGSAYGLNNVDVTGLAANGDATSAYLLAGAADSAQTYFSSDSGISWAKSRKEPTGGSKTYVLMAPDSGSSSKAYAATTGSESALSISRDNGGIWNQIGLIDTAISTINDLAPSPDYSQDNTLFMLTFGGEYSLWRSLDGVTTWERVFTSALADVDSIDLVELSPQYGNDSQVVFVSGKSNNIPAIWKSTNNGQKFTCRLAFDPTSGAQLPIDTWVVVDDTTLFIGSYDGSNGLVYYTTDSGLSYSEGAMAGSQSLNCIALSPNYEQDVTILLGNTNGWIYWSDDNGLSFEPLPPDATSPPLTDSVAVAFDTNFDNNNTVYAASNTANKGVYRFIIGKSTEWGSIDSTLPSGGALNRLAVSADGVLYAANSEPDDGMERALDPNYSLGPTFESVSRGLNDGATLSGLWLYDHTLWSTDTANVKLMTFADTLTSPVTLTSPASAAAGIGTLINHDISNVSLDWETLRGATSYQWQLDYDTDFSTVPDGFEGTTRASTAHLPALEPSTTYYWRVRATAPVASPWSTRWSFATSLDTEAITLKLESPKAGATGVPVKPVFQWSAIAGADTYELLVSSDFHFSNPSIVKNGDYALPATAWECDIGLNYDTTYYWKVRAVNSNTHSAWSAAGAFTTESAPIAASPVKSSAPPTTQPPPLPPAQTPSPINSTPSVLTKAPAPAPVPLPTPPPPPPSTTAPLPTPPPWIVYLIGALFLTIILLLVIVLVLVTGIRRF